MRAGYLCRTMIRLHDTDTGARIGSITEEELQFLIDALEEEGTGDQAYHLDADTIDMLASDGASEGLVDLLRAALGGRDGFEVMWSRE